MKETRAITEGESKTVMLHEDYMIVEEENTREIGTRDTH